MIGVGVNRKTLAWYHVKIMKLGIKIVYYIIFIFGLSYSYFLVVGLVIDVRSLDKLAVDQESFYESTDAEITSPYIDQVSFGVIKRGLMSDYYIDCSNGLINFRLHGGYILDYSNFLKKDFWEYIFTIYTLKEICIAGGVTPSF